MRCGRGEGRRKRSHRERLRLCAEGGEPAESGFLPVDIQTYLTKHSTPISNTYREVYKFDL